MRSQNKRRLEASCKPGSARPIIAIYYIYLFIYSFPTYVYTDTYTYTHTNICIYVCVYCDRRIGGASRPVANPALRGRL